MILTLTFSSDSFASVSASTSAEPCTSALTIIGRSFTPPSAICCCRDSSVRRPPLATSGLLLRLRLPERRDLPRLGRIGHRLEAVAWRGQGLEAEHFDRRGGAGRLDRTAAVVDERAHAADDRAGDDVVADAAACRPARARSPPDRGRDRAWSRAPCRSALRFGLALRSPISVTSRIISSRGRGSVFFLADTSTNTVWPPQSSGISPRSRELALHDFGIGAGLVDLVDGDDDLHVRGLGVIDGFPASAA